MRVSVVLVLLTISSTHSSLGKKPEKTSEDVTPTPSQEYRRLPGNERRRSNGKNVSEAQKKKGGDDDTFPSSRKVSQERDAVVEQIKKLLITNEELQNRKDVDDRNGSYADKNEQVAAKEEIQGKNQFKREEFVEGEYLDPEIIEDQDEDVIVEADEKVEQQDDPEINEKDLQEAVNLGMQAMNDLYYIKEPKLYSMGIFLSSDNPARHVASFNAQTQEAKYLAKFGYAALEAARIFKTKHPDISRAAPALASTRQTVLQQQCPKRGTPECLPASSRYRTADGSCNNAKKLWWGSAMSTMQRFLPPVYEDGIQTIRRSRNGGILPSAREVTHNVHEDRDVPLASITLMLMQWGQFVDHDITATGQSRGFNGTVPQCCLNLGVGFQPPDFMHPECLPIAVDSGDSFFGPLGVRCLEFVRSGPAPREDCQLGAREQLSQVTSYLDGSVVYSSNAFQSDGIRLFRNGLLKFGRIQTQRRRLSKQEADPCKLGSLSSSCFRGGDLRFTEQPALTSLHIVFLRLHNRIATKLSTLNTHWSDEKVYQETRRIVGAVMQHVTYREFLPIILGPDVMKIFDLEVLPKGFYEGYDPTINPNIANAFSTAAYRFGHSLVQSSFVRFDTDHRPIFNNVTLHEEFSNPVNLQSAGSIDRLILGLVNQPSQRRDEFISEELTNHLFQTPRFNFGMDLASLNIQRGRDHGLAGYTAWRQPCGLSALRSWNDLEKVMSTETVGRLSRVYQFVEDIDLYTGGLAEHPLKGGLVGPTFGCIIAQQFSNLRKADRFWYENGQQENSFSAAQLQQIRRITLAQVLCRSLDNVETIQPFVFLLPDNIKNQRISCHDRILDNFDLQPWKERPEERNANKQKRRNDGSVSKEERIRPLFQKPLTTNVIQKNRINVRRPLGPHENLTIVVNNHAVNSPIFVSDSIFGLNSVLSHTTNVPSGQIVPTKKPPRPIPTSIPQLPYAGAQEITTRRTRPQSSTHQATKPVYPESLQPTKKPRPIPTKIPVNNRPVYRPQGVEAPNKPLNGPYVPQNFEDPSNPNPLNQGYVYNQKPDASVYFDNVPGTTPWKTTLYTFYTNFYQKPTTPTSVENRPSYGQLTPEGYFPGNQNPVADHQNPSYPTQSPSSGSQNSYFQGNRFPGSQSPFHSQNSGHGNHNRYTGSQNKFQGNGGQFVGGESWSQQPPNANAQIYPPQGGQSQFSGGQSSYMGDQEPLYGPQNPNSALSSVNRYPGNQKPHQTGGPSGDYQAPGNQNQYPGVENSFQGGQKPSYEFSNTAPDKQSSFSVNPSSFQADQSTPPVYNSGQVTHNQPSNANSPIYGNPNPSQGGQNSFQSTGTPAIGDSPAYGIQRPENQRPAQLAQYQTQRGDKGPMKFQTRPQEYGGSVFGSDEVPKPLIKPQRYSEEKNSKVNISKPGKYYYDRNVLYRYPDGPEAEEDLAEPRNDSKANYQEIGRNGSGNVSCSEPKNKRLDEIGEQVEPKNKKEFKNFTDSAEELQFSRDSELKETENEEESQILTTTSSTVTGNDEEVSETRDDEKEESDDFAYDQAKTERNLDLSVLSQLEDTLEMPEIQFDYTISAKELPRPMRLKYQ